jgi:hypothetical protein
MRYLVRCAIAGAVALVVAGCGSNSPTRSKSAFVTHALAKQVAYAQCMRGHGVPGFPDPKITQSPQGTGVSQGVPASVGQSPAFGSAQRACAKLQPQGGGSGNPPPVTAAQHAQLVTFAGCMRRHGVSDMPDPVPNGSFNLPPQINQNAPAFTAAIKTCLPNGLPLGLNQGP